MKKHLLEAASLAAESASQDGTWKVRLISEGKGSSGTYPASLLENHHSALNELLSFKNHPVGWDGPQSRDFTMIAGEIVGDVWIEQDERGLTAVYGNYKPDPEYADKLERYKHKLGLSIYIEGSGYEDENGEFIVDWFNPEDPYASIDVVIAPGARGKFMESMREFYSAQESDNKRPGARQAEHKENKMDKETLEAALKPLADALAVLDTEKKATEAADAQAKADEAAVTSAVEAYDAKVKAIAEAGLPEVQAESLRAAAKAGHDVAPLIEEAKALKEEIAKSLKESANDDEAPAGTVLGGRHVESATELGKVFG